MRKYILYMFCHTFKKGGRGMDNNKMTDNDEELFAFGTFKVICFFCLHFFVPLSFSVSILPHNNDFVNPLFRRNTSKYGNKGMNPYLIVKIASCTGMT